MKIDFESSLRGVFHHSVALAFVSILATGSLCAATWHVGKNGVDNSICGLTSNSPCLTIQYTLDNRAGKSDTILISPGTYGEILTIRKSVILNGSNRKSVTVNGLGLGTVVSVMYGATATVENVTIIGGAVLSINQLFRAGGIGNAGVLSLFQVLVQGNSVTNTDPDFAYIPLAGGVYNEGNMGIYSSTISGNSADGACYSTGGLENEGTLTMSYSTVSGNSASSAGCSGGPGSITGATDGFWNQGNALMDLSYISSNGVTNSGSLSITRSTITSAGIALNLFQPATVIDSTIANNAFGVNVIAGFYGYNGFLDLYNSTLVNNGSDLSGIGGTNASISNSILGSCSVEGEIYLSGYDILQDSFGCGFIDGGNNLIDVSANLGPLRYNNGPTPTMLPLAGSPAINSGDPTGCKAPNGQLITVDQRNLPRPSPKGGRCDIGAVEVQQ